MTKGKYGFTWDMLARPEGFEPPTFGFQIRRLCSTEPSAPPASSSDSQPQEYQGQRLS